MLMVPRRHQANSLSDSQASGGAGRGELAARTFGLVAAAAAAICSLERLPAESRDMQSK